MEAWVRRARHLPPPSRIDVGAGLNRETPLSEPGIQGLVVVDKPAGLTSHDVVARIRRIAGTKRVGHTGTLDPMATGVLVLGLGKATRLIPYIEESAGIDAKEYDAEIRFGFETTTDDFEGEPRPGPAETRKLTADLLAAALARFVGHLEQIPPAFSAKKVDGQRAYAMARRGEEVNLKPVSVHVVTAELVEFEGDRARVRFVCSRGTYIRALARDLGRALGVGGHLLALRRTRAGAATLDRALRLENLTTAALIEGLIPPLAVLPGWPSVIAAPEQAADLRQGRPVTLAARLELGPEARIRVADREGHLIALARLEGSRIRPFCVF